MIRFMSLLLAGACWWFSMDSASAQNFEVRGTIKALDGKPLGGARVTLASTYPREALENGKGLRIRGAVTDARGFYRLRVAKGSYEIYVLPAEKSGKVVVGMRNPATASAPQNSGTSGVGVLRPRTGGGLTPLSPASSSEPSAVMSPWAERVDVSRSRRVDLSVELAPQEVIRGHLTDGDGRAVPSALVTPWNGRLTPPTTRTDAHGQFSVRVPQGTEFLEFQCSPVFDCDHFGALRHDRFRAAVTSRTVDASFVWQLVRMRGRVALEGTPGERTLVRLRYRSEPRASREPSTFHGRVDVETDSAGEFELFAAPGYLSGNLVSLNERVTYRHRFGFDVAPENASAGLTIAVPERFVRRYPAPVAAAPSPAREVAVRDAGLPYVDAGSPPAVPALRDEDAGTDEDAGCDGPCAAAAAPDAREATAAAPPSAVAPRHVVRGCACEMDGRGAGWGATMAVVALLWLRLRRRG